MGIALLAVSVPFLIWDIIFTWIGVWGFNDAYLTGIEIFLLPLEEWLFFLCIPYACLFTYDFVRYFRRRKESRTPRLLLRVLLVSAITLMVIGAGGLYSMTSFGLAAIFLIYCIWKSPAWLYNYLVMFGLILFPFIVSNGVLTGIDFWKYPIANTNPFVEDMIVWYDNSENLGFRIFSIPIEDIFYAFSLLGFQVLIIEKFRNRGIPTSKALR